MIKASNSAVGNGTKYYYEINSVLKVLLNTKIDSRDEITEDSNQIIYEKIFISHSSRDKDYVEQLIQLLNDIGISKSRNSIFCSSFEGYNIPIGEKIYDYIKKQFNKNTLVILILSSNYYESVASLNEMGAIWVMSLKHVAILLPHFAFSSIEGAIDPREISFIINHKERLNSFKDDLIKGFNLNLIDGSIWERDRNKFLNNIDDLIRRDKYVNSLTRVDIGRIKYIDKNQIELEIRFINKGQLPVEFQELKIYLIDDMGNEYIIDVDRGLLNKYVIYGSENRREVFTFSIPDSDYNCLHNKIWRTDSTSILAF